MHVVSPIVGAPALALSVEIVPLLADNYGYLLTDLATGAVAIVDPAEAGPVLERIRTRGGRLDWILLTHHHGDHVAGTSELVAATGAKVAGAAADAHRLPPLDRALVEGDRLELGCSTARILATPGHTTGHIAYLFEATLDLFCADTLFVMGCGRLIEGDAPTMWASLEKLAALPPDTKVWCGHEYTLANARFALSVDPDNEALRTRARLVERLRAVAGYDVFLFNSTMEHGIPSVWVVAKNRKQKGVNIICAAGAHPDPVRAVKGAIHEVAAMLMTFSEKFEANREQYERMLHDPFQVRDMEDHSMLYSLPQAEERLQFLLDEDRPLRTFNEEFKPKVRYADLTDDLSLFLQTFRRLNLDVIVVDQSTPETKRNGLYCVKVLIPGMLPMTFGQHLTRLTGLERVLTVPVELGYAQEPLTPKQLNPHPHPFP